MIYLPSELNGEVFKVSAIIPKISYHFKNIYTDLTMHFKY